MLWIKRNLFLAVGGLVAIALLAVGIYHTWSAMGRNTDLDAQLEENKTKLTRLYNLDPFPARTNVDAARRETERVSTSVNRMRKFFAAPPVERVTGLGFRQFRDKLLNELRESAKSAGVETPSLSYAFSFEEQRTRVDFDPRTFPAIPEQMADVQAIANVLITSRVNPLVNIRRSRVSGDDERSTHQSDYHSRAVTTNSAMGAIISPYEVTFQCLSAELATVLQHLAASPFGMVVKSVQVEAVEEKSGGRIKPVVPVAKGGGDRAVTVLNERRFQATLLIYVVRAEETRKDGPKGAKQAQ